MRKTICNYCPTVVLLLIGVVASAQAQEIYVSNDMVLWDEEEPWQVAGFGYFNASYDVQLYYDVSITVYLQDSTPFHFLDIESGGPLVLVTAQAEPGETYYIITELFTCAVFFDYCDLEYFDIFNFSSFGGFSEWDWHYVEAPGPDLCWILSCIYVGNVISEFQTPAKIQSVSGLPIVPLRSGPNGQNSIDLTASVVPAGGTFTWSSTSNKVSLTNTSSATVTVTSNSESASRNDVPIQLQYEVSGSPAATWQGHLTVVKPASLYLYSDTTNPTGHLCVITQVTSSCAQCTFQGSGNYSSYLRQRLYHVMDHLSPAQQIAGVSLYIEESYSQVSSNPSGCATGIATGQPATGDIVTDCFYHCSETCRTGGSCSQSGQHQIKINGYAIGAFSVTWNCSGVNIQ